MFFRRIAVAGVEGVRFDDAAVRNLGLEGFYHVPRQDVRAVLFARVDFDGRLAVNAFVDLLVQLNKVFGVDMLGVIDLGIGTGLLGCGRRFFAADDGGLSRGGQDIGFAQREAEGGTAG